MSTYDNAPPLDGWTLPTGRCCGEFCFDRDCSFCGMPAPAIPANIELSDN